MDLVVDANVLFAALIKDSVSYHLLFSGKFHLFTPEYVLIEFEKHKEELMEKTERMVEEFVRLVEVIKRRVNIVPLEELVPCLEKAEQLTPDPDDVVYFALALKLNCPIWSNDKKLKYQDTIKVYHAHELMELGY